MGATRRWVGRDLWNLLNLSVSELVRLYPEYSKGTIKGKKAYWKRKLEEGKITMPPSPENPKDEGRSYDDILKLHGISPETILELNNRGFHVGYIKNKEGEIEYTMPLPHARSGVQGPNLADFISPADPVNITPSKRKPAERDYRLIYAFGDAQIDYRNIDGVLHPIHDERVLAVHRLICSHYQPETIVNLGDTVDLAALSRFPADSTHFNHSMRPAFSRVHRMYAELRADNPTSRIVEVDSNHNTRLAKFVLRQVPALWNLTAADAEDDDWPVLSYPNLAGLNRVGVEWVSGYGAAEFVYGDEYDAPVIVFKHGAINGPAGTVMSKEAKANPEVNVVRGHGHQAETIYRTNRAGRYLAYVMVGASCSITGDVPSYHSAVSDRGQVVRHQEGWQQGGLMITDYGDGNYQFDQILIRDGKAFYEGREFDGNE